MPRGRRAAVVALSVGGLLACSAASLEAQENCQWLAPTTNLTTQSIGATTILRVTDPHLQCADGIRLRADSARHFENQDFYQLFGNALFEDPEQRIEGDLIRYWRRDGRVDVRGAGRIVRKDDGSVVTGDEIDLLQAGERRDRDQLTVTGSRPRVVFHSARPGQPADTTEAPWDVVADRLFFWGQESLTASGDVEIRRDSLEAFAEAAEFDDLNDRLALRRNARMITDTYELEGDSILGLVIGGEVHNLRAMGRGVLIGEDIRLAAPRITIYTPRGVMERLVAVRDRTAVAVNPAQEEATPPGRRPARRQGPAASPDTVSIFDVEHPERPVARAEEFLMVADSIEVQAPGEVLNRLIAIGTARAESTARDSLNTPVTPSIARRDWIDGDTIVASFAPLDEARRGPDVEPDAPPRPDEDVRPDVAPAMERPDTARREYRLEELLARVNARSLYRMIPADSAEARDPVTGDLRLAVHYVTGTEIRISFEDGEMTVMEVAGATEGVHVEPVGGEGLPRDTAAADTVAADTSAADSSEPPVPPDASPDTWEEAASTAPRGAPARPSRRIPWTPPSRTGGTS